MSILSISITGSVSYGPLLSTIRVVLIIRSLEIGLSLVKCTRSVQGGHRVGGLELSMITYMP